MGSDTIQNGRPSVVAITIAALTAVIFWSLKPIFISIIGERGDYAEVYVASGVISVAVSAVLSAAMFRSVAKLLRGGRRAIFGAASAACSGLFLALWYYGFYKGAI